MSERRMITVDGNEAAASVAYRTNEVIAIYPITPASPMGEHADAWSVEGRTNIWGVVPDVAEMQAEGGAAGAVHGALQAGAMTTTFTASQGLLLMIPNMYKIAGELTPFCLHVAARTIATHALSIFGDHSDVMAARQTGFAMLASSSVQEAHDFALISQAATLEARVPFLHFFDGFRTSHEVSKIEQLTDDDIRSMIDEGLVERHRERALTPDRPVVRGTAQNPDAFFQAREACTPFYRECPAIVRRAMEEFADLTGRRYGLVDYVGHPEAERVVVLMGSGTETAHQTVEHLAAAGEKVGALKIRLYRPFPLEAFLDALPSTVRALSVLDRTKEPGATGDPLYLDVVSALRQGRQRGLGRLDDDVTVVGGRYGLSSKEFTPAMVKAVLDDLDADTPRDGFTLGIVDDVSHSSLEYDPSFDIEGEDVVRAVFFGLGSDGTVGANKNSIKIIGEETPNWAQGYFVYDSKKSGAITISHLRFGPRAIRAPYLISSASFVACHQFQFLDRFDVLDLAAPGATFLLNAPYGPEELWDELPREIQQAVLDKGLKLFTIDAYALARELGLGVRINTIMQTCFFAISGVLPRNEAIERIKEAIRASYGKRGARVVEQNFHAVDQSIAHLHEVEVPGEITATRTKPPVVSEEAPEFVRTVTAVMMAGKGDHLPVSAFPPDGTWPTGTTQWEKRNVALEIPVWEPDICIQCNQCSFVCPHSTIRPKVYEEAALTDAPEGFLSVDYKGREFSGMKYTIQVAPEDCTGCHLCVEICPAKDKSNPSRKAINMQPQLHLLDRERENWDFFRSLPTVERTAVERIDVKGSQFFEPLFEFSGACAGCGETPYIKLLTQLFGDRTLIANATGCSSIYGANLPTTPYTTDAAGRGPAWSNSLFEDNAEFGFGFRLAVDTAQRHARQLLLDLAPRLDDALVSAVLEADQTDERGLAEQRERVQLLAQRLDGLDDPKAARLAGLAEYLVRKSVWLVGGDGWAYDIGYGGLDHVLAQGRDVNVLVIDSEVYSNTGGQASKATPLGASAKFAVAGKEIPKKDLGLELMSYGHVYVARVAFGAKMAQTVRAFQEADSYPGPSLIIAYSHCIAHGYDLSKGAEQQKLAVESGVWPLYRFDPRRAVEGEPPLKLDSGAPKRSVREYVARETRFRMVEKMDSERFERLLRRSQEGAEQRHAIYQQLAGLTVPQPAEPSGDVE